MTKTKETQVKSSTDRKGSNLRFLKSQQLEALTLIRSVFYAETSLDQLMTEWFKANPKLGKRDRQVWADALYEIARRRLSLKKLTATEETSPLFWPRLASLAFQDQYWCGQADEAWYRQAMEQQAHANFLDEALLDTPEWLQTLLLTQWDEPECWAFALACATAASLDIRVNIAKTDRDHVQAELRQLGIDSEPTPYSPWGLRLASKTSLKSLALFENGSFEIQDEGSQFLAWLVQPKRGQMVLDMCAGAGGKALALASSMRNTGAVYAWDASASRLAKIEPRLNRSGVTNIHTGVIANLNDPKIARFQSKFDRVLVDAPCSGLGTLRRAPDLKWRLSLKQIHDFGQTQKRLLETAATLIKPGGRLIYATCSVLDLENTAVAQSLDLKTLGLKPIPMQQLLAESLIRSSPALCQGDYLKLLPHRHMTDGFFAAVWERT